MALVEQWEKEFLFQRLWLEVFLGSSDNIPRVTGSIPLVLSGGTVMPRGSRGVNLDIVRRIGRNAPNERGCRIRARPSAVDLGGQADIITLTLIRIRVPTIAAAAAGAIPCIIGSWRTG